MGKVKDIVMEAEELGIEVTDDMSVGHVQTLIELQKATANYNIALEDLTDLLDNVIEEQQSIISTLTGVKSFVEKATKEGI